MIICLDNIIFELQRAGGISTYWYELVKRFLQCEEQVFFVKGGRWSHNILGKKLKVRKKNVLWEPHIPLILRRYLSVKCSLPPSSIFHSSYYRTPEQLHVTTVVTVHDFVYEYYRSGLPRLVHSIQKGTAIKKANGIICVSWSTQNDLVKLYPGIDNKKIRVIYNGISEDFYPLRDISHDSKGLGNSDKKIILYIGSRMKYKNFDLAVEVVARLQHFEFVIVGGGPLRNGERRFLEKKLKGRFRHVGFISSSELNKLYNSAFCLLYPSTYEGFGIPIGEAMKSGCPVVTTKSSSIPEVCGDAGIMVESLEPEAFASAILKLENLDYREFLIKKGFKQARKFSWDRCFQETLSFYKEFFQEN